MSNMSDSEMIDGLVKKYQELKSEIGKIIIGQDKVVDSLLISIFTGGHCLLVGVPGLAKTLMVNTLSKALGLDYSRIQFTPDLMPSDIIGSEILDENRKFKFVKGSVFANIVLADEINRTPPKTQAALLEAMQEKHVTVSGKTYKLQEPFFVLATQNPKGYRYLIVPAVSFVILSLVRHILNYERPYEKFHIEPLYPKAM